MAHGVQERTAPLGGPTRQPDPRRWTALAVLLVAGFMDMLDVTIVNVAVPSIRTDLRATYPQVEWVVNGYVLGFAALLVIGGRLGDLFGRRRLFLVGVGGFTAASALCGLAGDPAVLIAGRFAQGALGGLMIPQIISLIHVTFPAHERGRALGLWGAAVGVASATGLILGGVLVEWSPLGLGWRTIFLVNVPIGLSAMIAARSLLRESRSPTPPRVDLIGMVLAASAILMVVYPLVEGRSLGWPTWIFLLFAGGVGLLAGFVWYERWRERVVGAPLLPLGLFRAGAFAWGTGVWLIWWIALSSFFFTWTLYLQAGLGWSPLRAGLTASAFAIGAAVGSGLSVQVLTPRYGRRVLMVGVLLVATGFAVYTWIGSRQGAGIASWQMVVPLFAAGFGFGLMVAPMLDLVLTGVPANDAGSATGLLSTIQQVGMALGVALIGVLFLARLDGAAGPAVARVAPEVRRELTAVGVPATRHDDVVAALRSCLRDRWLAEDPTSRPESCHRHPEPVRQVLARAADKAHAYGFISAFGVTLWHTIGVLLLVFLGLFGLPQRVRHRPG